MSAAGVQTDKTADALKEFSVELNGMAKPVPADELTRANLTSRPLPVRIQTTIDISRRSKAIVYHLPDDYFRRCRA